MALEEALLRVRMAPENRVTDVMLAPGCLPPDGQPVGATAAVQVSAPSGAAPLDPLRRPLPPSLGCLKPRMGVASVLFEVPVFTRPLIGRLLNRLFDQFAKQRLA